MPIGPSTTLAPGTSDVKDDYLNATGGSSSGGSSRPKGLRPIRTAKEMLKADLARLQSDPAKLGLSTAQRKQMVSEATEAAGTQRKAQMQDLAQTALAGQGFQQGAFTEASRDVAAGAAEEAAQASQQVNELNRRIIDAEKNRILAQLDAARERARQNTMFWTQFGIDGASTIVEAAGAAQGMAA